MTFHKVRSRQTNGFVENIHETVKVSVAYTRSDFEKIKTIADRENRTFASVVRDLVSEGLIAREVE